MEQALNLAIAALVLALAVGALVAPGLLHSVVLFIAFGLVMTLAWVRLGALDVALAEAAIGAGLVGALLIDAVRQMGADGRASGDE